MGDTNFVFSAMRSSATKNVIKRKSVFLFATVLSFIFSQAVAQQLTGPLTFPGDRYIVASGVSGNLVYWDGQIVPEVIGNKDQKKSMIYSVATLLFYARAAGVDVNVGEEPVTRISDKKVREGTNYLIVFTNQLDAATTSSPTLTALGVDLSNADPSLQENARKGLIKQDLGCYARWLVDGQDHVKSMAIAVSSGLSDDAKGLCVIRAVISSLGVDPVTNQYNLSHGSPAESGVFSNDSEVILSLEAANFCRKKWSQYGASCPGSVISTVLSNNGNDKAIK